MALFIESSNPDHGVVNLDRVITVKKGKGNRIVFNLSQKNDESIAWDYDDEATLNEAWTWLQEEFFTAQEDAPKAPV